jgi:hypothetical protein
MRLLAGHSSVIGKVSDSATLSNGKYRIQVSAVENILEITEGQYSTYVAADDALYLGNDGVVRASLNYRARILGISGLVLLLLTVSFGWRAWRVSPHLRSDTAAQK